MAKQQQKRIYFECQQISHRATVFSMSRNKCNRRYYPPRGFPAEDAEKNAESAILITEFSAFSSAARRLGGCLFVCSTSLRLPSKYRTIPVQFPRIPGLRDLE